MRRGFRSQHTAATSTRRLDPLCRPGGTRDHLVADARRANMQAVRRAGTVPELKLRRALRLRGLRFANNKPIGDTRPDLILRSARVAVFIDGCWWHGCPKHYRPPKHNRAYWISKVQRNRVRDRRNDRDLRRLGWLPLRVWECDLESSMDRIVRRIERHVGSRCDSEAESA